MQCCRPPSAAARAGAPGRGQRAHRCRDHQAGCGASQLGPVGGSAIGGREKCSKRNFQSGEFFFSEVEFFSSLFSPLKKNSGVGNVEKRKGKKKDLGSPLFYFFFAHHGAHSQAHHDTADRKYSLCDSSVSSTASRGRWHRLCFLFSLSSPHRRRRSHHLNSSLISLSLSLSHTHTHKNRT